jgi:hypothetical protein
LRTTPNVLWNERFFSKQKTGQQWLRHLNSPHAEKERKDSFFLVKFEFNLELCDSSWFHYRQDLICKGYSSPLHFQHENDKFFDYNYNYNFYLTHTHNLKWKTLLGRPQKKAIHTYAPYVHLLFGLD